MWMVRIVVDPRCVVERLHSRALDHPVHRQGLSASVQRPQALDHLVVGDGATVDMSQRATPSVNLMPSMTLGNWFLPFSLRQVFESAWTSLKTISFTVFCDSEPLVRTVRCLTVAKTLSVGLAVRSWSECSAGKS